MGVGILGRRRGAIVEAEFLLTSFLCFSIVSMSYIFNQKEKDPSALAGLVQ